MLSQIKTVENVDILHSIPYKFILFRYLNLILQKFVFGRVSVGVLSIGYLEAGQCNEARVMEPDRHHEPPGRDRLRCALCWGVTTNSSLVQGQGSQYANNGRIRQKRHAKCK